MTKLVKAILFLAILTGVYTPLWAQWADNFSDGDFSSNPLWEGNTIDFTIDTQVLRLNAPAQAGVSYLTTASDVSQEATWQFFVKLDFNPSSSNYAKVFLMADNQDLTSVSNGYYVKIGGTTDEVSLYKVVSSTETLLIDGIDGRVSVSPVEITVKVTRDVSNLWQVSTQLVGETGFTAEGTVSDAEVSTSQQFGVLCNYTSSRSTKFYFDDFSVTGHAPIDDTPPILLNAAAVDTAKIALKFNEPLDTLLAKQPGLYVLNNSTNPIQVETISADSVLLQFATAIDLVNSLTLANVPDVAGNELTTSVQVLYIDPAPYTYRQLVLNELLADPTPAQDLPLFEFVELYNNSNRIIDFTGWQFTDGSKVASLGAGYILPDSFLLIGPTEIATEYAPYGAVMGLSNWPSLNNSGDALKLMDSTGTLIDSVTYALSWYNDAQKDDGGWSLEHIAPSIMSSDSSNWTASLAIEGGTPGKVNSVYDDGVDTTGPMVVQVTTKDIHTIRLVTDEPLMAGNVLSEATYTLNGAELPNQLNFTEPDTIDLVFNNNLELVNTLEITNLKDTLGNKSDTVLTVYFIDDSPLHYRDIVINEIFADPSPQEDLPPFEFIELLNMSKKVIDLEGWQYTDGSKTALLPTHYLMPDSLVILCPTQAEASYKLYGSTIGLATWPTLNNGGDSLVLSSAMGEAMDSVAYTDVWYNDAQKDEGGWSLEQINPNYLCQGAFNWTASVNPAGGSPGVQNSVYSNTNGQNPEVSTALATGTLLELWFTEPLKPGNYGGKILPGNIPFTISLNHADSYATYNLPNPLELTATYTLTLPVQSCFGVGASASANVLPIATPQKGELVINELLFNPYSGGSDFVELFNPTSSHFNLKHFSLTNASHAEDLTDTTLILAPGHYLALSEDILFLKNEYLAPDSSLLETNTPSMPDDEGILVVKNALGITLDSVFYSDSYHFSLLSNTEGVSLERISATEPSTNPNNWRSGAETTNFATPGYENAQSRTPVEEAGITVTPQVITPNNDGRSDFMQIWFELDGQSQVVTITIYNLAGQLIKTVASNAIVPPQGFFTWDGTDQQGAVLPTAHYIVISEITTSDGRTITFKNKAVVANGF